MASIEMKNIVKKYGDGFPAVNDVSLDIADGEFMILVGPSGCGKSTLLRMIVGPGGHHLRRHAHRRQAGQRQGAARPQPVDGLPELRALPAPDACTRTSPSRCGWPRCPTTRCDRRVKEAADVLELHEHLERKPANLSGGQRQRVAMGRAIVRQAEAFLFDEPLSNLDAKLRGQMRTEISRLQRRLGITTVYVTHDQTEAMTLGDRVCVLRKGSLQQVASPRELYEQPVNLFVAGFIGSPPMNFLPATVEGSTLETPFGTIELDEDRGRCRRRATSCCSSASGPSTSRTPRWSTRPRSTLGSTFTARVDVTEWLGDQQYAYIPFDAPDVDPHPAARAVPRARQRAAAHPGDRLDRRDQPDPRGPRRRVLARHPQGARLRPGVRGEPDPRRRGRRRADPDGQRGPRGAGGRGRRWPHRRAVGLGQQRRLTADGRGPRTCPVRGPRAGRAQPRAASSSARVGGSAPTLVQHSAATSAASATTRCQQLVVRGVQGGAGGDPGVQQAGEEPGRQAVPGAHGVRDGHRRRGVPQQRPARAGHPQRCAAVGEQQHPGAALGPALGGLVQAGLVLRGVRLQPGQVLGADLDHVGDGQQPRQPGPDLVGGVAEALGQRHPHIGVHADQCGPVGVQPLGQPGDRLAARRGPRGDRADVQRLAPGRPGGGDLGVGPLPVRGARARGSRSRPSRPRPDRPPPGSPGHRTGPTG